MRLPQMSQHLAESLCPQQGSTGHVLSRLFPAYGACWGHAQAMFQAVQHPWETNGTHQPD